MGFIVFTPRQCEAMHCVAHDMTIGQTALALHISPETVRFHLQAAKERAGVRSLPALLAKAVASGSVVMEDVERTKPT